MKQGISKPTKSKYLLWAILALVLLADALDVIDATITNIAAPTIAHELGGASGSFSSVQQLSSAIGSAAVASVFFQAASSGFVYAMEVALIVVLALTVFSIPFVALMPPQGSDRTSKRVNDLYRKKNQPWLTSRWFLI